MPIGEPFPTVTVRSFVAASRLRRGLAQLACERLPIDPQPARSLRDVSIGLREHAVNVVVLDTIETRRVVELDLRNGVGLAILENLARRDRLREEQFGA